MIRTSYFAKAGKFSSAIAISQGIPEWYNGDSYRQLAPPWEIIKKGDLDPAHYKEIYYQEVLSKLDPKKVADDLDGSILLCHEKDSTFCHRRIVAEWLEAALGISVPEIKYEPFEAIYQRPDEYPELGLNPYKGCSHDCLYCFNKRQDRGQGSCDERTKKVNLKTIKHDLGILREKGNKMPVLLSLICDPYDVGRKDGEKPKGLMQYFSEDEQKAYMGTTDTDSLVRRILRMFLEFGQPFQILTKGGMLAARDFDLYGPNDRFGVTLTFDNEADSKKWEPGAALPADRIASLKEAHNRGIRTWVSCEPVIFPEQTLRLIDKTQKFVDLFVVGKLNRSTEATWIRPAEWPAVNWQEFRDEVEELLMYRGKQPGTGYQLTRELIKATR